MNVLQFCGKFQGPSVIITDPVSSILGKLV